MSRLNQHLTLRNLEKAAHEAQAFAVVDPDKYPITVKDKKQWKSEKNVRLIRQLRTSLIASYFITMSTQAGASQHIGRPHLIDDDWYRKFGLYHPDLCNLGLTGDTEHEAYYLYKDKQGILDGLDSFDETTYQHHVETPKHEFLRENEIKEILGRENLGYVVAIYGSSTGFGDETYSFPRDLTYALSRLRNVMTVDGGGVRSGMKGMKDGPFQAIRELFQVFNLGVRSNTDVSPLEGNHETYFEEVGYPLEQDPNNEKHAMAADGQVHVLERERILPRQAAIAEIAHATVICDGGKGTVLEFFITATHNAMVNMTGRGLLGHRRVMPLVVLNRDIEVCGVKRGIFDALLEPWRDHHHIIGLREFTGQNPVPEALQFLKDHAEGRRKIYGQKEAYNFDLSEQKPRQLKARPA